jgi:hypothetical protein
VDPVPDDTNQYRYVRNGPTNAADSSGLQAQDAVPYEIGKNNPPPVGVPFVSGPTVDVVSWIQKTEGAEKLMNDSANPEPPLLFEPAKLQPGGNVQPKQWGDFLNTKQFRNHLFVKLTVYGKNDRITAFGVSTSQNIGYTPVSGKFVKGDGNTSYKVTVKTSKQVSVEVTSRFIVDPILNLGQSLANRRAPLPFAWVSLEYTMWIDKKGNIQFLLSNLKGSLVPSQYFYVNGELVAKYNMDNKNSAANIKAFNNALGNENAPLQSFDAPGVTYSKDIEGFTDLTKKK